ncbi:MAG: hypothetical protein H5T69_18520, partial [Chloroflexi bacterium]|nr:hypothetical protein [Chloroflexota bacterium]
MSRRQRSLLIGLLFLVSIASFTTGVAFREVWERRGRIKQAIARRIALMAPSTSSAPTSLPPDDPTWPAISPAPTLTPTYPAVPTATIERPSVTTTATLAQTHPGLRERLLFPLVQQQVPTATPTFTPTKTKRPSPTPTPTLPWPPALEKPGRSKLGLHVQWNNSSEIMEFVRRMKPPLVKAVGDFGFLNEVKQVSPTTVTVARVECAPRLEGDPVEAARAFVAEHLETYRLNPAVDYWEGVNEPQMGERMEWFAAFEAERARVMAEHGFRVAVGTFSAGTPEWEEFERFLPAIQAARRYNGILTVHEYDAPMLDRSLGAGLPGHPNYPNRGALALRYRWWYEDMLKPRGLVVPLAISEVGVDGWIANRPGPKGKGWLDFRAYWVEQGLAEDGIKAYLRQLDWYDEQLQQDG